jgi:parallel beta-helix repeat protein
MSGESNMRYLIIIHLALILLFYIEPLHATIIHVPGDSTTIQGGIDGTSNGDTVVVADGIYTGDRNKRLTFMGKSIVVMSENGPENCIIDCEQDGSGVHFDHDEGPNSIFQGFTVQNGHSANGGGIWIYESSPTIINNIIVGNTALGSGGGIYCYHSPDLTIIDNNVIVANTADFRGGGIYSTSAEVAITNNWIAYNTVEQYGGGISDWGSSPSVDNNVIFGNTAREWGAGVEFWFSNPELRNNTIVGNVAIEKGGGLGCGYSSLVIDNTIFSDNFALIGSEIYIGTLPGPSTLSIYFSDVEGGQESIYVDYESTLLWGNGMIEDDPLFVYADKRDYRLLWGSPCIDSGHPGRTDPDSTRSDMGALFFNQGDHLTLYLTPDTTEVARGGRLGVTYTLINRWSKSEPFWGLTRVILPSGGQFNLIGPNQFTLPANSTIQQHFYHDIPVTVPLGGYEYLSQIGFPPSMLYDEDRFMLKVVE